MYTPKIEEISISKVGNLPKDSEIFSILATGMQEVNLLMLSFEPYKHTCLIISTFPNGKTYSATGTLVGANVVLIAAHGVYRHDNGGEARSISISIGLHNYYDSEETKELGFKKNLILPKSWVDSKLLKAD